MATGRNRKAFCRPKQHFPTPLAEKWRQEQKKAKSDPQIVLWLSPGTENLLWLCSVKCWQWGSKVVPKQLRAAKLPGSNYLIVPLLFTGLHLHGPFGTDCRLDPRDTLGGVPIDQIVRKRQTCLMAPDLSQLSLSFPSALCFASWFAWSCYQFLLLQLSSVQQSFPVGD